ncbi:hypothetical protein [Hymenobacter sp. DG01]|uniref:hypothetical protein n=1 Tax=Hymenobacter sp. DG01 TaxID=2584940 RepID=UPI00111D5022|nr:hypothetical protein [Hymenobacter sp. DG01]
MPAPPTLPAPMSLLGFAAFWAVISWLLALNGWRQLAQHFRASTTPPENAATFRMLTASLRRTDDISSKVDYRGVLTLCCSPAGLGLAVLFPFRIGHPPLLVPWSAVGPVQLETGWFGNTYFTFTVGLPDETGGVEIRLMNMAAAEQVEAHQQLQQLGR